ncbi:ADP-ribosylation/Crystallin J1 [Penicillium coprophilum]|uniref:ADP-ribosylation/Crystallin J1 n=1 Tax=Penicillium coprophilum TaxID=36646 RepID=UPI0023A47838|nr:ADP-ribosylation/Crystallin J1 [Penicillium coprophilum]KAJ5169626.1 ADP-ribosylation/Crystallin J1 [Penicillium coprophilum]
MSLSLKSRAKGAIWGVCVADALGGPVQFRDAGTFEPITTLRYVAPFDQPAGSYSDDGSMTLALACSFSKSDMQYNHMLSIQYFVEWLTQGHFSTVNHSWDVGRSTRISLTQWIKYGMEKGNFELAQVMVIDRLNYKEYSGNGSLMRIVPIGVAYWYDSTLAREVARKHSQITHPSLSCVEACEAYTDLVCRIMNGQTKKQLFHALSVFPFTHPELTERMSLYRYRTISDWKAKAPSDMTSSGWVVDTLECAMWAFFKYDTWKDGALAVVNLGGDSDTAGAVYGGLAGSFYGFASIPAEWVAGMQNKGFIGSIADALSDGIA